MIRATVRRNKAYTVWLPLLPGGRWRRYTRRFIGIGYPIGETNLGVAFIQPKAA